MTDREFVENLVDTVIGSENFPGLFFGEMIPGEVDLFTDRSGGTIWFQYIGDRDPDFVRRFIANTIHKTYADWEIDNWTEDGSDFVHYNPADSMISFSFHKVVA
jgi:hypothetical protein